MVRPCASVPAFPRDFDTVSELLPRPSYRGHLTVEAPLQTTHYNNMAHFIDTRTVQNLLETQKNVMRLSDIIEKSLTDELAVRRDAERLEIDGTVTRFVVGGEVFLRLTESS